MFLVIHNASVKASPRPPAPWTCDRNVNVPDDATLQCKNIQLCCVFYSQGTGMITTEIMGTSSVISLFTVLFPFFAFSSLPSFFFVSDGSQLSKTSTFNLSWKLGRRTEWILWHSRAAVSRGFWSDKPWFSDRSKVAVQSSTCIERERHCRETKLSKRDCPTNNKFALIKRQFKIHVRRLPTHCRLQKTLDVFLAILHVVFFSTAAVGWATLFLGFRLLGYTRGTASGVVCEKSGLPDKLWFSSTEVDRCRFPEFLCPLSPRAI